MKLRIGQYILTTAIDDSEESYKEAATIFVNEKELIEKLTSTLRDLKSRQQFNDDIKKYGSIEAVNAMNIKRLKGERV